MSFKKKIISLYFIVFMFCAVFTPDFFSFSMRYLIVILSSIQIFYNLFKYGKVEIDFCYLKVIRGFIPFVLYFIVSQFIRILLSPGDINMYLSTLIHLILSFLSVFIIVLCLIISFSNLKLSVTDFINIIIVVMFIQFLCVLLALVFPNIRNYFNLLIINNSHSERLAELAIATISGWGGRSYGLCNNLFDSFGYITALLIIFIFTIGIHIKNNKILIFSIIMILMPLVNARTGIVLVLFGFFITSLFYTDLKSRLKFVYIILFFAISIILLFNYLPESTVEWIVSGFKESIISIKSSESIGVYSEIFGVDLVLPKNIIFGEGVSPTYYGYNGIDNGYINCVWNFGVVGTFLLLMGYINMFFKGYIDSSSKLYKVISINFMVVFFLYLFKIYSIDNFGGNVVVFTIPILMMIYSNKTNYMSLYKNKLCKDNL